MFYGIPVRLGNRTYRDESRQFGIMESKQFRSFFYPILLIYAVSVFGDVSLFDISSYPTKVQEHLKNAQHAFKEENYAQALGLYKSLSIEEPKYPIAYIGQGDCFAKLGDYQSAIVAYKHSLHLISKTTQTERFSYEPFMQAKLATAYHRNKQLDDADEWFQKAVKGAGENAQVTWYIALGQIETERDNLEKARRYYIVAVQLYPDTTAAYNNLGHVLLKLNRLDEADAVFRHTLMLDQTLGSAAYGRGEVAEKRGNFIEARQYYEQAIQYMPKEPIFYRSLADILAKLGDTQGATTANMRYKQTLAEVYRQQAHQFIQKRQGSRALELLRKALDADETYLPAVKDYAYVQMQLDNLEPAKQAYLQVLKTRPSSRQALLHLGMIESRLGNRNEAESYFQALIKYEPDFMDTYYQLSKLRETSGDLTGAENALTIGIQHNPLWAPGYLWRGKIYQKDGKSNKAETDYRQAIKLAPDVPFPKDTLAALLATEKRSLEEALMLAKSAVASDNQPTHIATLAYVYYRLNRITDARREITRAYSESPKNPYVAKIRSEIFKVD